MAEYAGGDMNDLTVSTAEAARMVGCSKRWIQKRARAGYFQPVAPGEYRLVDIVAGFERQCKEAEERARGDVRTRRLREAQAQAVEARVRRLDAKSIDLAEALEAHDAMAEMYLQELDALRDEVVAKTGAPRDGVEAILGPSRATLARKFAEARAALGEGQGV